MDLCHHMAAITVQAPPEVCFSIWDDWNRLVDFLDLVSQVRGELGQAQTSQT